MIPLSQKLGIGATGALCLSLLKLINANFYLGAASPEAALGAYLTYGAYLILGMAVGYFFCEEHQDVHKTRKSVFVMGLLAPSILIAIVTKPIADREVPTGKVREIPPLSWTLPNVLVPAAHAQALGTPSAGEEPTQVRILSKKDVVPGFKDGVKAALGIQQLPAESLLFVVGKTSDRGTAIKTATSINGLLQKTDAGKDYKATVFRPEASDKFYVAVGDFAPPSKAFAIDKNLKEVALRALAGEQAAQDKAVAKLLVEADLYSGAALFQSK